MLAIQASTHFSWGKTLFYHKYLYREYSIILGPGKRFQGRNHKDGALHVIFVSSPSIFRSSKSPVTRGLPQTLGIASWPCLLNAVQQCVCGAPLMAA